MEELIICIPAYNPTNALTRLINNLIEADFISIIVVDDGSSTKAQPIFDELKKIDQVTILQHGVNLGKGAAIKTAIHYLLHNYKYFEGIITCGADGQHEINEIRMLAKHSRIFEDGLIVGIRDFHNDQLPWYFRFQNEVRDVANKLVFHKKLIDFQSGLRFLPFQQLSWIKSCKGEHTEFDMNVLLEAMYRKIPIYELPIGKVKVTQSSFLQYDEKLSLKQAPEKLLKEYLKKRETF